jgi:hypothetical protein
MHAMENGGKTKKGGIITKHLRDYPQTFKDPLHLYRHC